MKDKWKVFILGFVTYGTIHAVRTGWASIKPQLQKEPYDFSEQFEGDMDMVVLLCLAFSLHLFGWLAGKWNVKYFLLGSMLLLVIAEVAFGFVLLSGSEK